MLNIKNYCVWSFSTQLLFLELVEYFKTKQCFKIFIYRFRFWNVSPCLFSDLAQNGATIDVNLPIVDMLYNGHLVIAATFLRNWLNHGQTLIEKPLYSRHFYSGYLP